MNPTQVLPADARLDIPTTAASVETLGTAGNGFVGLKAQSVTPGAPASGLRVFADASGNLGTIDSAGNVYNPPDAPASSTDNAVVRFDGVTGAKLQNSVVTVGDTGAVAGVSTLSASGQITSTLATGSAPLVVASTTNVANLNASSLNGATMAAPGAIGGTTPSTGAFTTLTASSTVATIGVVGNANVTNTTAVGSAFTNQPANDGVTVVSDDAGDTTQSVTIIGTTTGTNTVVTEDIALNGVVPVNSVKVDWGVILAVKKSAATLGTVTVSETSGGLSITAGLTAAVLSVGVNTAANTAAYTKVLSAVASGATTKQIGFKGTDSADAVIYDSAALAGTAVVLSNSVFKTLTEIYTGDVENTVTATTTAGLSGADYAGTSTGDAAQAGKIGQLLTAQVLAANTMSVTTATGKDITTLQLTAGDWEVSGAVIFVPANTTTVTQLEAGISTTADTEPSADSLGGYSTLGAAFTGTGATVHVVIPPTRLLLTATTTYHLVAKATFGVSTCTAHGFIRARRAH